MSDALLVNLPVSIRAETSLADPDTCKFIVSRTLHPGGPFFFGNKERAAGSPLGERLFALPGVANVLIAESVDHLQGAHRLVVRTESRHRDGHPHAVADWRTSDLGDACPHRHARKVRCRA